MDFNSIASELGSCLRVITKVDEFGNSSNFPFKIIPEAVCLKEIEIISSQTFKISDHFTCCDNFVSEFLMFAAAMFQSKPNNNQ